MGDEPVRDVIVRLLLKDECLVLGVFPADAIANAVAVDLKSPLVTTRVDSWAAIVE